MEEPSLDFEPREEILAEGGKFKPKPKLVIPEGGLYKPKPALKRTFTQTTEVAEEATDANGVTQKKIKTTNTTTVEEQQPALSLFDMANPGNYGLTLLGMTNWGDFEGLVCISTFIR
jgi:hypothetical protein